MRMSKDEERSGYEKYISGGLFAIYALLLISLRMTLGAFNSHIVITLIVGLALLLLTSLSLIFKRHVIVRTWYKGNVRKQVWFWFFGFAILLIYIVIAWLLAYGFNLLFDLYIEYVIV